MPRIFLIIAVLIFFACDNSSDSISPIVIDEPQDLVSSSGVASSSDMGSSSDIVSSGEKSSSSGMVKSSSSVVSSSSYYYNDYCRYISASAGAYRRPSAVEAEYVYIPMTMDFSDCFVPVVGDNCPDGSNRFESQLVKQRAEVLVKNGENAETAEFKAQKELYALIGMDIEEKLEDAYLFWDNMIPDFESNGISRKTFTEQFVRNGNVKDFDACEYYYYRNRSCDFPSYCHTSYLTINGYKIPGSEDSPDSTCSGKIFNKIDYNFLLKCGNLPPCEESMNDSVMIYEDKLHTSGVVFGGRYVCKDGVWSPISDSAYTLRYETCDENNKRVNDVVKEGFFYVCYEGMWISSDGVDTRKLPVEYFFNQSFDYGSFEDPRDNHVYRTTEYEGHTWLAENLKYLPESDSLFVEHAQCSSWYGCDAAGILYGTAAAQKACPDGWRLPAMADFEQLVNLSDSASSEYAHRMFTQFAGIYQETFTDEFGLSFVPFYMRSESGFDEMVGFWLKETDMIILFKETKSFVSYKFIPKFEKQKYDDYDEIMLPVRCIKE